MSRELRISVRDPIIARDGRPFGGGARMKPLAWMYPSTVAGTLRTVLGKLEGSNFTEAVVNDLKRVQVRGPLPVLDKSLYFPAPRDAVARAGEARLLSARPLGLQADEGSASGLTPVCLPMDLPDDFKPEQTPAFWSAAKMREWLLSPRGHDVDVPGESESMKAPTVDFRTQTSLDKVTGSAKDGMLFETAGLVLPNKVELSVRVEAGPAFQREMEKFPLIHPLGGERRLVWIERSQHDLWACPGDLAARLSGASGVRMVLATPGIFEHGWLPGWLQQGHLPGSDIGVKLHGAIFERWRPVSGWSLERGNAGPKPVRRLVPAGSVYFLKTADGSPFPPLPVENLWLQSVCDDEKDRLEGFGLALWGIWDAHKERE